MPQELTRVPECAPCCRRRSRAADYSESFAGRVELNIVQAVCFDELTLC